MYSLTYVGVITTVVGMLFGWAGVPFVETDLHIFIAFATKLVGVVVTLYGRYRAGGIDIFGRKTA